MVSGEQTAKCSGMYMFHHKRLGNDALSQYAYST